MKKLIPLAIVLVTCLGCIAVEAQVDRGKDPNAPCVAVIGAVHMPGRFELKRRIRLLEVLAIAGGFTDKAGQTIQITSTGTKCAEEVRDASASSATEPKVRSYRFDDINTNDEIRNPYLEAGDIVVVPEADSVYIIGSVVQPRQMLLKGRVTLTQAIAFAGGATRDAVDRATIIRQTKSSGERLELKVDLNKVRKKQAEDPVLQPNDIIEVQSRYPRRTGDILIAGI